MLYTPYKPQDLRDLIKQVLTPLSLYSDDVAELLLFTCANESHMGIYRTQAPNGPARGIFQVEGPTFTDVFRNYLLYHPNLDIAIGNLFTIQPPSVDELVTNDKAAIAIARVQYLRAPGAIPKKDDLQGIWNYYKKYYNTVLGAATQTGAMLAYEQYVTNVA